MKDIPRCSGPSSEDINYDRIKEKIMELKDVEDTLPDSVKKELGFFKKVLEVAGHLVGEAPVSVGKTQIGPGLSKSEKREAKLKGKLEKKLMKKMSPEEAYKARLAEIRRSEDYQGYLKYARGMNKSNVVPYLKDEYKVYSDYFSEFPCLKKKLDKKKEVSCLKEAVKEIPKELVLSYRDILSKGETNSRGEVEGLFRDHIKISLESINRRACANFEEGTHNIEGSKARAKAHIESLSRKIEEERARIKKQENVFNKMRKKGEERGGLGSKKSNKISDGENAIKIALEELDNGEVMKSKDKLIKQVERFEIELKNRYKILEDYKESVKDLPKQKEMLIDKNLINPLYSVWREMKSVDGLIMPKKFKGGLKDRKLDGGGKRKEENKGESEGNKQKDSNLVEGVFIYKAADKQEKPQEQGASDRIFRGSKRLSRVQARNKEFERRLSKPYKNKDTYSSLINYSAELSEISCSRFIKRGKKKNRDRIWETRGFGLKGVRENINDPQLSKLDMAVLMRLSKLLKGKEEDIEAHNSKDPEKDFIRWAIGEVKKWDFRVPLE